jgi:PD-(D/E)XK endonuclease
MRPHHTKNKGDLGILHAQLDLAKKGYGLLAPITEHEAFDLVAYRDRTFLRVQVKYRTAVNGAITVPLKASWADRHGVHSVHVDTGAIDLLCIYCPDTDRCYYVDPLMVRVSVVLRVDAARNNQRKGIAWAKDHLEIPATVRGVLAGSRLRLEEAANVRQSAASTKRP